MRILLFMHFVVVSVPFLEVTSAHDDNTTFLMEYLERKCQNSSNDYAWIELKAVIQEFPHRLITNATIDIYHDLYLSICYDSGLPGYLYLQEVVEKLQPCLDLELMFLPHFIINTFNDSIERHCGDKAVDLISCSTSTSDVIVIAVYSCLSRLWHLYHIDYKLTESYLCEVLLDPHSCMFEFASDKCESDLIFTYFSSFLDAGLTWCGKRLLEQHDGSMDPNFSAASKIYFTLKCLRNGGPNAMSELMEFADEAFPNLQGLSNPATPKAMHALACIEFPEVFYPYIREVMNKVDLCLDTETKFLPSFALSTFNNTIQHLCKAGEELFVVQLETIWNVTCRAPNKRLIPALVYETCGPEIIAFNLNEADYNHVLTESFFCQKLGIFVDCIVQQFVKHCSAIEMSKYLRMLLQPALEWCGGGNATVAG